MAQHIQIPCTAPAITLHIIHTPLKAVQHHREPYALTVAHHSKRPELSLCAEALQRTPTRITFNHDTVTPGMPIMFDHTVENSNMSYEERPEGRQTCYGHPRGYATICGHALHPSTPRHTPLCPACIASRAKSSMDAATKVLIAEGGLVPPEYFRDRRWQRAKLRYEIAKRRQAMVRSKDQLRDEREQAWEDMHQRFDSRRLQATPPFQHPAECPVCASMMARFPTKVPAVLVARDTAWWERTDAPAAEHSVKLRNPLRPVKPAQHHIRISNGPSVLRTMIQQFRKVMADTDAQRQAWETRYRTESAVRRKYSLGEGCHFDPDFWDEPVSAPLSRKVYQEARDYQRMAERRARGNAPRPRPPRSSLSHSEHTDEVRLDEKLLEEMLKREEMEIFERQARKVGEEVGYLYFVGGVDGLCIWREDFLRSYRQLVFRNTIVELNRGAMQSEPEEDQDEEGEAEEEEETEEDESFDEMDTDE